MSQKTQDMDGQYVPSIFHENSCVTSLCFANYCCFGEPNLYIHSWSRSIHFKEAGGLHFTEDHSQGIIPIVHPIRQNDQD